MGSDFGPSKSSIGDPEHNLGLSCAAKVEGGEGPLREGGGGGGSEPSVRYHSGRAVSKEVPPPSSSIVSFFKSNSSRGDSSGIEPSSRRRRARLASDHIHVLTSSSVVAPVEAIASGYSNCSPTPRLSSVPSTSSSAVPLVANGFSSVPPAPTVGAALPSRHYHRPPCVATRSSYSTRRFAAAAPVVESTSTPRYCRTH
ncbi:unnamed protein product [Linum trigynum]|uniref:Uncharacterized protein n=1 Tax=Linum trigynum TaxID=586398 RepID=A0AAV2CTJ8_9ROSI